jgi:hypothetical protein
MCKRVQVSGKLTVLSLLLEINLGSLDMEDPGLEPMERVRL